MKFDLHVHTTYSDGLLTPNQVVDLAIRKGIDGIAITDHDTILGIEPAIRYSEKVDGIFIIPGIEFGCVYNDEEVHILGYFIDYRSSEIINITAELRKHRVSRSLKIIEKINNLGIKLNIEEIEALAKDDYIGRPHIARALVKKGYVSNVKEAFEKYLDRGKSGYVERYTLTLEEAITLIHKLNGLAVLAHPGLIKDKKIISHCIRSGIDGLEAIHSKHNKKDIEDILEIGNKHGLIITGGSDCHGEIINNEYLLGKYYININDIRDMKGRI